MKKELEQCKQEIRHLSQNKDYKSGKMMCQSLLNLLEQYEENEIKNYLYFANYMMSKNLMHLNEYDDALYYLYKSRNYCNINNNCKYINNIWLEAEIYKYINTDKSIKKALELYNLCILNYCNKIYITNNINLKKYLKFCLAELLYSRTEIAYNIEDVSTDIKNIIELYKELGRYEELNDIYILQEKINKNKRNSCIVIAV